VRRGDLRPVVSASQKPFAFFPQFINFHGDLPTYSGAYHEDKPTIPDSFYCGNFFCFLQQIT
jgi:hypothetical protein